MRGRDKKPGGRSPGARIASSGYAGKRTPIQARYGATAGPRRQVPETPRGGGKPLPQTVRAPMEQSLGADFSEVRIHEGNNAAELSALAYAQGADIHFAPGQYDPNSAGGLELLGHELAHTVQQAQGRVAAPTQAKGGVNDDTGLEREADELGARAARHVLQGTDTQAAPSNPVRVSRNGGPVQAFNRHRATGPAGQGPNTVSRGAATETTASYKSASDILGLTISQFVTYADGQADWSMEISDDAHKAQLRQALTFIRGGRARQTALRNFRVDELVIEGLPNLDAVDAYCRGRTRATLPVNQAATITEAGELGADILILENVLGANHLAHIFTATIFDELRTENRVTELADYIATCNPLLHAHDGVEIESFLDTTAPASFNDLVDVRNYHRFEDEALKAMRKNQAGNAANKPMTLVLQSAFDHNGAFHHDHEMTIVLASTTSHAVMVEGAGSLDAISGRLPALVEKHGRTEPDPNNASRTVKRIDQLMIAGHGSSQSMELAGTLATGDDGNVRTDRDGDPVAQSDDINIHSDPRNPESVERARKSRELMSKLMGLMSTDPSTPHGRIVLNACLTASNEIDPSRIDANASVAEQQQQMRQAMADSPSLVTAMRQIAGAQGRGQVSVLGGSGSFGVVGLSRADGGLDIVADGVGEHTDDPELTNPDKFAYVERGRDPGGCLSAVAECWANDKDKTLEKVRARRAAPNGDAWKERVIQCFYELVDATYANSGADIARLAHGVEGFKSLSSPTDAAVWRIWSFTKDWEFVHGKLSTHGDWTGNAFVPMVFYQAWMWHDHSKIGDFLTAVGAMTCRTAYDYANVDRLRQPWTRLVPAAATGAPNAGSLRLALLDIVMKRKNAHASTKAYLGNLVADGAFTVDVNGPLDGLTTADDVLMVLNLHPRQQGRGGDTPPEANVDMDNDGANESTVQPLSRTGVVTASALYARAQPTTRGRPLSRLLRRGERVYVMGQTGNWYLLDMDGQRGYSYKRYIDLT